MTQAFSKAYIDIGDKNIGGKSLCRCSFGWKFEILTITEPARDNIWFPMGPNKSPLILYQNWTGAACQSKSK